MPFSEHDDLCFDWNDALGDQAQASFKAHTHSFEMAFQAASNALGPAKGKADFAEGIEKESIPEVPNV